MKCPQCQADNSSDSVYCRKCGFPLTGAEIPSFTQTMTFQAPVFGLPVDSLFAERYRVKEQLGSGGMGKVYRVVDETIDEEIALKLIRPEIASDKKTIERFKNELKLSRSISHAYVCRMYHLGEVEGIPYITMEFIKGEDLKSIIQQEGALPCDRTIQLALQICRGLAEAHKHGVVHRDLKPGNIMIDDKGMAKIMDFGIARSVRTETITESGMMVGTLDYMSPEQAGGIKADNRADIYSLGVILFEMVTGALPFKGETPISTALKHQTEAPPPPMEKNPSVPESLNSIILKCLEKSRENRYQTVEDLITDLEKTEKGGSVVFPIASKEKEKKIRWPYFAVPALLLALLASVYFVFIKGWPGQVPEKQAEVIQTLPQEKATPPPETSVLQEQAPAKEESASPEVKAAPLPPGIMEIDSNPSGAAVYLNGRREGQTPFVGDFEEGRYSIRLSKAPEYKDFSASLTVTSGQKTVRNYTLPPNYVLNVGTIPEGADVTIDGSLRGRTPLKVDLTENRALLMLEMEGWTSVNETLDLKQGENSVSYTLQRSGFKLSIKTEPDQATVFVDDQSLGLSPIDRTVLPGSHSIRIEKLGYKTFGEVLNIQADFDKTYQLEQQEAVAPETSGQTGKITVKVLPFSDVYIDGVLIGEVPPSIVQEVRPGKHALEFVSTSLNKKHSLEVDIKPGENVEVRMNMNTGESEIIRLPEKK
jgi:serine/threonine protein kinase